MNNQTQVIINYDNTQGDKTMKAFETCRIVSDKINDFLDLQTNYAPRNQALEALGNKLYLTLEAEINAAINEHTKAAFWLGWEAAKNPAQWIFKGGNPAAGFSDADPGYVFWERMHSLDLGDVDASASKELDEAVTELMADSAAKAFGLGWQTALDPSWLIFANEREAQ